MIETRTRVLGTVT